jgi:hypothetical protein
MDLADSKNFILLQSNLTSNPTYTMKKRIWIPLVVVLAVCLLLLFRTKQPQPSATPQPSEALTNQPSNPEPAKAAENRPVSNTARTTVVPPVVVATATHVPSSNGEAAAILAAWQAPIEFYGKVVDENSNAIAGVNIHFNWSELPAENGERTADAQSDSEGLFTLNGKRGASLTVSFSKQGYYSSGRGEQTFSYALPKAISPDPLNPVIFKLRKKGNGESLIKTDFPPGTQIAQLHHDGTPVELDLLKGAQVPAGSGQLKLEFWRDLSNGNANIFDWKLQLSVLGGGLIGTDEEFAFQAPESGYQSPIVIDMPATNQNWQGEVRSKYYIQLPDGKYGRIDFYLLSDNGVFTVQSVINPTGSRNLEPMEVKTQGTAPPPGVRAVIPEFK